MLAIFLTSKLHRIRAKRTLVTTILGYRNALLWELTSPLRSVQRSAARLRTHTHKDSIYTSLGRLALTPSYIHIA